MVSQGFPVLRATNLMGVPVPVIFMFLLCGILYLILNYTTFGRYIYNVGANYEAARFSGVPIRKSRSWPIRSAASCRPSQASSTSRGSMRWRRDRRPAAPSLPCGHHDRRHLPLRRRGRVGGTILGAIIMSLIINGMNLLSIDSYWHQFVIGAIVIISVWVDQLRAAKFQAA